MYMEIKSALDALRETAKLAGTLKEIADSAKLNEVRIAIQEQVIAAQERVLELQSLLQSDRETIAKQRDEISCLHRAEVERDKYKLRAVVPGGAVAYFAAANSETGEPEHWLCQPCFDAGKKVALKIQPNMRSMHCAVGGPSHAVSLLGDRGDDAGTRSLRINRA